MKEEGGGGGSEGRRGGENGRGAGGEKRMEVRSTTEGAAAVLSRRTCRPGPSLGDSTQQPLSPWQEPLTSS